MSEGALLQDLAAITALAGIAAGDAQQGLGVLQIDFAAQMFFLILGRRLQNLLQVFPREILQHINLATGE